MISAGSTRRRGNRSAERALLTEQAATRALAQLIQPAGHVDRLVGDLRVSARCVSADPGVAIGGDWFLSMPLAGGDVLLAVGDVMGHGMAAAATMIRLRFAMAAYAAEGCGPAQILDRLNTILSGLDVADMATAVIARYNGARCELRFARAGHMPILLGVEGAVRVVPNPAGPVLGVFADARFSEECVRLPPGSVLLMHTDGLVPRGQSADDASHQLAQTLADTWDYPADTLDRLDYRCAGDDACVLVAEHRR